MSNIRAWIIFLFMLPVLINAQVNIVSAPALNSGVIDLCLPQSGVVSYQGTYAASAYDSLVWTLPGATPAAFTGDGPFSATYTSGGLYNSSVQVYAAGTLLNSTNFTVDAGDSIPSLSFASSGSVVNFNNDQVFSICTSNPTNNFFFQNNSSGYDSYTLNFGDGSALQTGTSWDTTSHTYNSPGLYNVTLTLENGGCGPVVGNIKVFFGSSPSAQLTSSSNLTGICIDPVIGTASVSFNLSGFGSNPPGTIYRLYFSDDSTTQTYSHPPPTSISHTYTKASCGALTSTYNNSFFLRFSAENPCGQSAPVLDPITLSSPPSANFKMPFDSCRGVEVPLVNISNPGANITYSPSTVNIAGGNGDYLCDTSTNSVWEISPASYTVTHGILGFRSTKLDPNTWIFGFDSVGVRFNQPGIYTVKMIISGTSLCPIDSIVKTICIDEVSSGNYSISDTSLCAGDILDLAYLEPIITNCDTTKINWQISPPNGWVISSGTLGDSSLSLQFNNSGSYQLIFEAENNCGSTFDTVILPVIGAPRAQLPVDTSYCGLQAISLNSPLRTVLAEDSTGQANYRWRILPASGWSFINGTDSSSLYPEIDVQAVGSYQVIFFLDNSCFTASDTMVIAINPQPVLNVPSDTVLCAGDIFTTNLSAAQGSAPYTYSWMLEGSNTLVFGPLIQLATLTTDTMVHVFLSDNESCVDSGSFRIRLSTISSQLSAISPVCYSDTSSISSVLSGGYGAFTYRWIGPNTSYLSDTTIANPSVDSLGIPGTYVLRITDSLGCEKLDSIFIDQYPFTKVEAGPDTLACDANSLIDLNYGAAPLGGVWSGAFVSSLGFFDPVLAGSGSHMVYYQFMDVNGCSSSDSLTLNLIPAPSSGFTVSDSVGCSGSNFNATSSADPTLGHQWFLNDSLISTNLTVLFSLGNRSAIVDSLYQLHLVVSRPGLNCTDTLTKTLVIYPKPLADFILPDSTCASDTLPLISSSLFKGLNPDSLRWSVNSPAVSILNPTSANTSIVFPDNQSGLTAQYQVSLYLRTADDCSDTLTRTISIFPRPTAIFTQPANACGPYVLQPSDASIGNNLGHIWSISPAVASSNLNTISPTFTIPASSTDSIVYQINLLVTDAKGCSDSSSQSFTLYPLPTAAMALSNRDSCTPLQVQVLNNSGSGQTGMDTTTMSFVWDFGNGTSSNMANPGPQTFSNSGTSDTTYYLSLISTNAFGCSDTVADSVIVRADPNASFIVSSFSSCAPFIIDSSIVSAITWAPNSFYNWEAFTTNGTSIAGTNFSGPTAFNYTMLNAEDSIRLRLIVSRSYGCRPDTLEQWFFTVESPEARFSLSDTLGCSPLMVQVSDSSVAAANYQWFVNDVLVSNLANPNLALNNPNALQDSTFSVKLVVSAISGCYDTLVRSVLVFGAPRSNFTFLPTCDGDTVNFIDSSLSQSVLSSWLWDFGDGTTDTLPNPKHFYSSTGLKIVSLTVTDDRGCSAIFTDTVGLYPNPLAIIAKLGNCEALNWCKDQVVSLQDSSTVDSLGAPISKWFWDVDADGNDDYTTQHPQHTFTTTGPKQVRLIVETAFGCRDTAYRTFQIVESPNSDFEFDSIQNCGPHTISLINRSQGRIDSSQWTIFTLDTAGNRQVMLSDTSFQLIQSIVLNSGFNNDSIYYFELISSNCCGSDTLLKTITMTPYPVARFLASSLVGCSPFPLNFQIDGLTTGAPDYLILNYGDGQTDTILPSWVVNSNGDSLRIFGQPSHVYYNTSPGDTTFIARLSAYNECGDSTVSLSILIRPSTVQAFMQVSLVRGCEPLAVSFSDFSFGGTSVSWCLDWDSISGSCNQPVASGTQINTLYTTAGTYVVAQFVNDGCSFDTAYQIITVDPAPTANFSSTNFVCEGDSVFFNDLSVANGSFINSYRWFFGDGDSSSLTNPMHIYNTSGTLEVRLIISSANGCPDTITQSVTIYDSPEVNFGFTNSCFNNQPLQFSDSTTLQSGTIVSTFWDFGDGNTATTLNPQHRYNSPGLYTVQLTKTSSNGCVDSARYNVNIFPIPTANYSYLRVSPDSCSVPQEIQFTDLSLDAQGYYWDFNFGGNPGQDTSNLRSPSFVFTQYGEFEVALIATNSFGCADTLIQTISVRPVPNAGFVVDSTAGCMPLMVQFTDTSAYRFSGNGSITGWQWDFGDGSFSNIQNPQHQYGEQGLYFPSLIVRTDGGCSDTIIGGPITVYPKPSAAFEAERLSVREVQFRNQSANLDSSVRVLWTFGDGRSSAEIEPRHIYNFDLSRGPQSLEVCLFLINGFGCADTICETLLLESLQLNVPNALAPSDLGSTDANVFLPKGHALQQYHLQIFDRWGNIVFESRSLDSEGKPIDAWDGRHFISGIELPMGAYTWRIDATFNDGTIWLGSEGRNGRLKNVGNVTLIR